MPQKREISVGWRDDVAGWLDSLRAGGLSEMTIRTRRQQVMVMSNALKKTPEDVTGQRLVTWFAGRKWMPETRKGYRNAASSFFEWLHRTGRRPDDPSEMLPSVKRPHTKPRPCPDRVIIAALNKANEGGTMMIRLAAECGLRRAEIAQVSARDVMDDLLGHSLIVHGKGDKQRIVPLPDDLAKQIIKHGGWLYPGRWTGHVEPSYVGKHVTRLLGDGWSTHSLRHRFATRTYEETHDLYLVSKLLGHESVETTQRYVAMPDSRLHDAMQAVRLVS